MVSFSSTDFSLFFVLAIVLSVFPQLFFSFFAPVSFVKAAIKLSKEGAILHFFVEIVSKLKVFLSKGMRLDVILINFLLFFRVKKVTLLLDLRDQEV